MIRHNPNCVGFELYEALNYHLLALCKYLSAFYLAVFKNNLLHNEVGNGIKQQQSSHSKFCCRCTNHPDCLYAMGNAHSPR